MKEKQKYQSFSGVVGAVMQKMRAEEEPEPAKLADIFTKSDINGLQDWYQVFRLTITRERQQKYVHYSRINPAGGTLSL